MIEAPARQSLDLWSFYEHDLEFGRVVRCTSARTLLHYLASPSTTKATVASVSTTEKHATINLFGPVCDDEEPLRVRYRLTRGDFLYRLDEEERDLLFVSLARFGPSKDPEQSLAVKHIREALSL